MAPKAKKSEKRDLKRPLIAGGLLAAVLITVLIMNASSVIKAQTEKLASQTLGVPVTIAAMHIKPSEKTITVAGLNIANPDGYQKPHAIHIDKIKITADSLARDLLKFKDIQIDGTDINLEVIESGTNLTTIRNHMNHKAAAANATEAKKPIKVIVSNLLFKDAVLNPSMTLIDGDLEPVTISSLQITGLGERRGGILASEAMAQIMDQLVRASMEGASQNGFLQGLSVDTLRDMGLGAGFVDQAKENLKNLSDGIKNLFGGD